MSENIVIDENVIAIHLPVTTRDQVLEYMIGMLEDGGYVKETFRSAILEREARFSTGLPTKCLGVAIPHTDPVHVNKSVIGIATVEDPVNFLEMGNPDREVTVQIVFMIALSDGNSQVHVLTKLMQLVQDEDLLRDILKADSRQIAMLMNERLNLRVCVNAKEVRV